MRVRLISLLALMVFSCDPSDGWYAYRSIVNETDYTVQLEVLGGGDWYTFTIEPQAELLLEGWCLIEISHNECKLGWPGRTDSANLIFDESRILSYSKPRYGECEQRNVASDPSFECHGYEAMEIGKDTIQYTYRITEADYQSAQPITE